jgi:hypothetical protein
VRGIIRRNLKRRLSRQDQEQIASLDVEAVRERYGADQAYLLAACMQRLEHRRQKKETP